MEFTGMNAMEKKNPEICEEVLGRLLTQANV